jgi:hypothetical protein
MSKLGFGEKQNHFKKKMKAGEMCSELF